MLQQCLGEDAQGPIKKDDLEGGGGNDSLLPTNKCELYMQLRKY